jgi:anti-sigma B factor antagonist
MDTTTTYVRATTNQRSEQEGPKSSPFDGDSVEYRLEIEGAFDALTVHGMRSTIDAIVAGQRRVVVDLERVSLMDSSGVGVLVSLWRRIRAQGGSVVVVHAHDQPLAVLKLLKLDAVFGRF